ncbi:TetR/AcrR family transcriptional regulator [Rhizobium sp. C1]|uniref:TetR/AcrR family transcriptional regulator n=1 Tax=Rhizobium sp. C1 TaxID=1349799 RepID=UPI001E4A5AA9|nr:TetR/AcrR family transcriptional regulator [Rhizobium sp. C1]MCD2179512.1 TetR/AcrR family transcriptional regulator [Rhizobium sp. C1]
MRIDKIHLVNQIFYRHKNLIAKKKMMAYLLNPNDPTEPGLRSRKKAKRRDEIIAAARALFASQGIDATTMADIANAVGISAPTVFNYFGSKDGVLIALISEGTMAAREEDRALHWHENTDLGSLVLELFLRISSRTLEIADKRVWRYAESAAIRNPEAELSLQYQTVSEALITVVAEFFDGLALQTRSGSAVAPEFLARLFHDVWMQCFINLITNEDQTLAAHEARLRTRLVPLVHLLFDETCIASPARKSDKAKGMSA